MRTLMQLKVRLMTPKASKWVFGFNRKEALQDAEGGRLWILGGQSDQIPIRSFL